MSSPFEIINGLTTEKNTRTNKKRFDSIQHLNNKNRRRKKPTPKVMGGKNAIFAIFPI